MSTEGSAIQLSIVATIYNCIETINTLVEEIALYAGEMGVEYEIILVDDASRDGSAELLESLCAINPRLKCIFLSKNHGQQLAMSAGIHERSRPTVLATRHDNRHIGNANGLEIIGLGELTGRSKQQWDALEHTLQLELEAVFVVIHRRR